METKEYFSKEQVEEMLSNARLKEGGGFRVTFPPASLTLPSLPTGHTITKERLDKMDKEIDVQLEKDFPSLPNEVESAKDFIIQKAKANPLMKGMETNEALIDLLNSFVALRLAEAERELKHMTELHDVCVDENILLSRQLAEAEKEKKIWQDRVGELIAEREINKAFPLTSQANEGETDYYSKEQVKTLMINQYILGQHNSTEVFSLPPASLILSNKEAEEILNKALGGMSIKLSSVLYPHVISAMHEFALSQHREKEEGYQRCDSCGSYKAQCICFEKSREEFFKQ